MKYYFEKTTELSFENTIRKITEELQKESFVIVAEIDMQKTLKEKIGVSFNRYTILEACNPPFAYKSLQAEDNIGIMLPCNIVVRQISKNTIKVAIVNSVAVIQDVNNPDMDKIAK